MGHGASHISLPAISTSALVLLKASGITGGISSNIWQEVLMFLQQKMISIVPLLSRHISIYNLLQTTVLNSVAGVCRSILVGSAINGRNSETRMILQRRACISI